jgi:hypothetical protein
MKKIFVRSRRGEVEGGEKVVRNAVDSLEKRELLTRKNVFFFSFFG